MEKKKWLQITGRICSLLWWLIVIASVILLFQVSNARRNDQVPKINGYAVFRITTGSMEPQIPTGMYILVKETPGSEIKPGDIITFYSEDPTIAGMPNTHRVVGEPVKTSQGLVFETRGDANYKNDDYFVAEQKIIGRYCRNLEGLTALVNLFMTKGMLIVILMTQALSGVMMMLSFRYLKQKKKEQADAIRESKEKLEQEIARKAVEEFRKAQEEAGISQEATPEEKKPEEAPSEPERKDPEEGKEEEPA